MQEVGKLEYQAYYKVAGELKNNQLFPNYPDRLIAMPCATRFRKCKIIG